MKKQPRLAIVLFLIYLVSVCSYLSIHNQYLHMLFENSGIIKWEIIFFLGVQLLLAAPLCISLVKFFQQMAERTRRHREEMEECESRYHILIDALPDFVVILSQGVIRYVNDAAAQLLGQPVIGSILARSSKHEDPSGRQTAGKELHHFTRPDGTFVEVEYFKLPINYKGSDAVLYLGRDITEQNKTYRDLAATQGQLHNLLNSVDTGIWSFDIRKQKMLYVSAAYKTMYGIPPEETEINPLRWQERVFREDLPEYDHFLAQISEQKLSISEFRYHRPDGEIGYMENRIVAVTNDEGTVVRLDGVNIDVTDRVNDQNRINFLAYHDELTGLPNRRMFRERLKESEEAAAKNNEKFAIIHLDLDKFKNINDTLGHQAGDLFLISIGARLYGEFDPKQHTIARLGGDEFTLILNGIKTSGHLEEMIARMEKIFQEPFLLDGIDFSVTASIGISIYPDDGTDVSMLMNYSDSAMFLAKEMRNGHKYHHPNDSSTHDIERLHLQIGLQKALDHGEFSVFYQPKHQISDNRLIGAEALIRWQHPKLGQVSPGKFIPIAEEIGLIKPIGEWVLEQVCRQIAAWQNIGYQFPVSVNLSVKQFREESIVEWIRNLVERTGIHPALLELEITESMAMDIEKALSILQRLRKIGVRISVDDFGIGYSSLNYLKKLPVHQLKIDKSFIHDINKDPGDAAIVSTIVTLAHNLNLKVIAEGVENVEQLDKLRELDCDEAQGYLFNKPLPLAEFETVLHQHFKNR